MNIKHLKIKHEEYRTVNSKEINRLENLSKINIFIGENNSGKSRFLRSIYFINNNRRLEFIPNDIIFDMIIEQIEKFKNSKKRQDPRYSSIPRHVYLDIEKELNIENFKSIYLEESKGLFSDARDLYRIYNNNKNYVQGFKEYFGDFFDLIFKNKKTFAYDFYKIYIPSLRGLIPVTPKEYIKEQYLKKDFYAERTKKDYFGEEKSLKFQLT